MKQLTLGLVLISFLMAGCVAPSKSSRKTSLFNGRDLTGWVAMHGGEWTVSEHSIIGRNGVDWTTNPEKSGSWLRTEKSYRDFELELEYSINPKGNSGVFFHSGLDKNPAFTGHEVQILDDRGQEPKKYTTGSLYDVVAPSKNMSRPAGEWNQMTIRCQGNHVRVTLNGETIVQQDSQRNLEGYIGLQNHDNHAVVKFRNLWIREL